MDNNTDKVLPSLFNDDEMTRMGTGLKSKTAGLGMRAQWDDYEAFVDKFQPRRTSDDCYTPRGVYEAVKGWVADNLMPLDGVEVVRPFYPGGDYEKFDYPDNCLVLDNPPFSILKAIRTFYHKRGITYFLFGPSLTLLSGRELDDTYIISGYSITYANGAKIPTSFVTNIENDARVIVAGDLTDRIKAAESAAESAAAADKWRPPRYVYPPEVTSPALLQKISSRGNGIRMSISKDECAQISALDSQRAQGKGIFGHGWLISDRAAAAAAAAAAPVVVWELSEREKDIQAKLNK